VPAGSTLHRVSERRTDLAIAVALLAVLGASFGWVSRVRRPPAAAVLAARGSVASAEDACLALTTHLCADLGDGGPACLLAREQVSHFSSAHCAGMLGRYPEVRRELQALERGLHAIAAREQTTSHGLAPSRGPRGARLTLVEFGDFSAADCGRIAPLSEMVSNLYGERVRVVFRQYPSEKHPDAALAAEASLAAHEQGKFWAYHDVLFANPHDLGRPALERYAIAVGLDMTAFRNALDEHRFASDVAADAALARQVQAFERPSLFANGKRVEVPYGAAELAKLIESELGRAK
jgi:hypothetical protein